MALISANQCGLLMQIALRIAVLMPALALKAFEITVSNCSPAERQADICQLGMDQRKVNMLAREYCDDIKRKLKPIIISHAMLPGLLEVPILSPCPVFLGSISTG